MENQHAAVEEQEEQILADYGDQDESDGEVELDDISFSCAGLSRISIIDGEVGDTQPLGKFLSFLEDPRVFVNGFLGLLSLGKYPWVYRENPLV